MPLRNYQNDALAAIKTNHEKGISRQVVAMATGTGKTQCFAHLPDYIPGQTLVLAHREELIDQAIDKLHTSNPHVKISKEMAGNWADGESDIIVASVATIGRKNTDRAKRFPWDNIRTIITDECHHSTSTSYKNIYEMADVMRPDSGRLHVGFTATPQRSDNKGLSEIYDKIVYTYDIRRAIEDKWLVDVKGIRVHTQTSLDEVSTQAGDFNQSELAQTVNTPARNKLIVKTWIEKAKGRRTIAFTVDIQHAQDLAKAFQDAGVKAEAVWGDDPDRAQKIADHKAGKIDVLTNCGVLTEGYDDPAISCIILARPTKSSVLFTQCIGRGTRLYVGKIDCLVIDVVDSTSRHNLIMLPSLLGMPSQLDLQGKGLVEAVKLIEAEQELFPHIDFTSLKDINELKAFIEEVNLWEPKIPAEIDAHTEMIWHPAPTGGYVMLLPDKDEIRVTQNLLDKWEVRGKLKGKRYKGERDSLDSAFAAADNMVKTFAPDVLKLVQRDAPWHKLEPTPGQLRMLKRIYKKKPIPHNMTRGWASKLIGAGKAQKG
jgi:superfamily II DNA or RNA helicase